MAHRFKGLPVKKVEGFTLPDAKAYEKHGLEARWATSEYAADLGKMDDDAARLQAGQEVNIREVVPAGEPGAGPVEQEMVVVEWDRFTYTNLDGDQAEGYRRAMSFTREQFDALFEEV